MKTKRYIPFSFIMIVVAVIGFSGCAKPGKVTGGGWMPSKACLDQNCEDGEKRGVAASMLCDDLCGPMDALR